MANAVPAQRTSRTVPKLLVMGAAGDGKTPLAAGLARALAATLIEGDDREPWLGRLGDLLAAELGPAVLTCAALKRRDRDRLRAAVPSLRTVCIDAANEPVAGSFDAQEAAAEEPAVLVVPSNVPLPTQIQIVLRWLAGAPATT